MYNGNLVPCFYIHVANPKLISESANIRCWSSRYHSTRHKHTAVCWLFVRTAYNTIRNCNAVLEACIQTRHPTKRTKPNKVFGRACQTPPSAIFPKWSYARTCGTPNNPVDSVVVLHSIKLEILARPILYHGSCSRLANTHRKGRLLKKTAQYAGASKTIITAKYALLKNNVFF